MLEGRQNLHRLYEKFLFVLNSWSVLCVFWGKLIKSQKCRSWRTQTDEIWQECREFNETRLQTTELQNMRNRTRRTTKREQGKASGTGRTRSEPSETTGSDLVLPVFQRNPDPRCRPSFKALF